MLACEGFIIEYESLLSSGNPLEALNADLSTFVTIKTIK
jgi:hypothetical protein